MSALDRHERELQLCTYCPRLCHFACPSALGDEDERATAWGMMWLANRIRLGEQRPDPAVTEAFFHCASCNRCTAFCRHGNDVPNVLHLARAEAVRNTGLPTSLRPLEQNLLDHGNPNGPPAPGTVRPTGVAPTARIAFFSACDHARDPDPTLVPRLLDILSGVAGEPVVAGWGLGISCCGGSAERLGLPDLADRHRARLLALSSDFDVVLSDCEGIIAKINEARGRATAMHVARYLAERADRLPRPAAEPAGGAMTYHCGCRERQQEGVSEAESALLRALGSDPVAARGIDGIPECCGGEVVFSTVSPDGAGRAARQVVDSAADAGESRPLVTSSVRCGGHMRRSGRPALSLLELVVQRCSTPR